MMYIKLVSGDYCDWHVGEPVPVPRNIPRVCQLQADGDELELVIAAMKATSSESVRVITRKELHNLFPQSGEELLGDENADHVIHFDNAGIFRSKGAYVEWHNFGVSFGHTFDTEEKAKEFMSLLLSQGIQETPLANYGRSRKG